MVKKTFLKKSINLTCAIKFKIDRILFFYYSLFILILHFLSKLNKNKIEYKRKILGILNSFKIFSFASY